VELLCVATAEEALEAVGSGDIDCAVLDTDLSGIGIAEFQIVLQRANPRGVPAVLFSNRDLTELDASALADLTRTSVVRVAYNDERLLAETTALLHRRESDMSERQRGLLDEARRNEAPLANRKILVVDDDVRNIFALTSILEVRDLKVIHAENGRAGIELLKRTPDVDLVLMDIMMPEMDGYETMRAIRRIPEFRDLPIVALTAKAMLGDRDKCIEAGASDYIPKPVDLDQLFSVLRVWIGRDQQTVISAMSTTGAEA
jgi:CheY-like chemotaxis protein